MEKLLKKAKEVYGTSEKCNLSTFLLPDGTVLNSDKYFTKDPEAHLHDKIVDKIQLNLGTSRFIDKTGAIRYHPTKDNINLSVHINNPITDKQVEFLEVCSCFHKGNEKPIIYDFYDSEKFIGHDWTKNPIVRDCFKGVERIKKQVRRYRIDKENGKR